MPSDLGRPIDVGRRRRIGGAPIDVAVSLWGALKPPFGSGGGASKPPMGGLCPERTNQEPRIPLQNCDVRAWGTPPPPKLTNQELGGLLDPPMRSNGAPRNCSVGVT